MKADEMAIKIQPNGENSDAAIFATFASCSMEYAFTTTEIETFDGNETSCNCFVFSSSICWLHKCIESVSIVDVVGDIDGNCAVEADANGLLSRRASIVRAIEISLVNGENDEN
jgi:hypothetical protein